MPIETNVTRTLLQQNIPFRVFQHPGPVTSLEQAARERGQRPEQVVRSLVFRIAEGEYVMVLMAGPNQVPWKALRQYLGQSRLTTASDDELLTATGYRAGAVSPFGLPAPLRMLVDRTVLDQSEISIGSGERGITVILSVEDLKRGLGDFEVVSLGENA
jgi:Cys-tRNA(Pro) deacylase